jgi:hypothetical protein
VRDLTFNGRGCRARTGHAARNLVVVRYLARTGSIAAERLTAALDDACLTIHLAVYSPDVGD